MKEETIIDLVVKYRNGEFPIIVDKINGLSPNIARDLIDTKYTTKERRNEKKRFHKLLRK